MNIQKRYSSEELKEFEAIILHKLEGTNQELRSHKKKLRETSEHLGKVKMQPMEDSPEAEEREKIDYQIKRLESFKKNLEQALQRIHKGTYGRCMTTGQLIPKERLRLVPHTTHTVFAKENRP